MRCFFHTYQVFIIKISQTDFNKNIIVYLSIYLSLYLVFQLWVISSGQPDLENIYLSIYLSI